MTGREPNTAVVAGGRGKDDRKLAIYALVIYTAPCVMLLMRADPLRGQVGGGTLNTPLHNRELFVLLYF